MLDAGAYEAEKRNLDSLLKGNGFEAIEDDEEEADFAFEDEQEVLVANFNEFGEKLDASVISESYELQRLGKITNIIENSIIVQSLSDIVNLDVDTVVLFRDRRILGKIMDLFGPVRAPLYIVKVDPETKSFVEEQLKSDSSPDLLVFYVKECSNFVLPAQLMKSNENEHIDADDSEAIYFSDDEKEQEYISKMKPANKDRNKRLKKPSSKGMHMESSTPSSYQSQQSSPYGYNSRNNLEAASSPHAPQMHFYPMHPQNHPGYYPPVPPNYHNQQHFQAMYYAPPNPPQQHYAPPPTHQFMPYPGQQYAQQYYPQHQHQSHVHQQHQTPSQYHPQANSEVQMPVFYSPPRRHH
jgi:rRNA processing protein Gar1